MNRKEALNFLTELGKRISEDNYRHGTKEPVFCVEQKVQRSAWHLDEADGYSVIEGDDVVDCDLPVPVSEFDESSGDIFPYVYERELVGGAVALTREGIDDYLRANKHNLREPRVWVESLYRVKEMISLREALVALSTEEDIE